jgi:hypothetical protein
MDRWFDPTLSFSHAGFRSFGKTPGFLKNDRGLSILPFQLPRQFTHFLVEISPHLGTRFDAIARVQTFKEPQFELFAQALLLLSPHQLAHELGGTRIIA